LFIGILKKQRSEGVFGEVSGGVVGGAIEAAELGLGGGGEDNLESDEPGVAAADLEGEGAAVELGTEEGVGFDGDGSLGFAVDRGEDDGATE
jgi:hypothetical protein